MPNLPPDEFVFCIIEKIKENDGYRFVVFDRFESRWGLETDVINIVAFDTKEDFMGRFAEFVERHNIKWIYDKVEDKYVPIDFKPTKKVFEKIIDTL